MIALCSGTHYSHRILCATVPLLHPWKRSHCNVTLPIDSQCQINASFIDRSLLLFPCLMQNSALLFKSFSLHFSQLDDRKYLLELDSLRSLAQSPMNETQLTIQLLHSSVNTLLSIFCCECVRFTKSIRKSVFLSVYLLRLSYLCAAASGQFCLLPFCCFLYNQLFSSTALCTCCKTSSAVQLWLNQRWNE